MIVVTNLKTNERLAYDDSIGQRKAVICAYALSRGDFLTWMYETKYGHLVELGEKFIYCGDWAASKG